MADQETEQQTSFSPPQDERRMHAPIAVCEENLAALLGAVTGRPEPDPAIAPAAYVSPPDAAELSTPSDATPPAPSNAEPGPEALAADPQPHLVSKLALIEAIKQRRAATARLKSEISSPAPKHTTSEVPPGDWVITSAEAIKPEALTKDAAPLPVEASTLPPEPSKASTNEISSGAADEPRPGAHPNAPAATSVSAYSTPAGSTLLGAAERPGKDVSAGAFRRWAASGPVLGTLAGVTLTVGFTAFLLMGHATKSTTRAPKSAAKESVQNTGTGLPPAALSTGEQSSIATPSDASAGADLSRQHDQSGAKPEPAQSAQVPPVQSTQIPLAPSAQAAPTQPPPETSRTAPRTFAPPVARGASPESVAFLDAPPALSALPAAPLAPGVGVLPSGVTPPPPPAAPAATAPIASVPRQINIAGSVQAAKLIRKVTPLYPPVARTAHVQGTVRIRAVIGVDGQVKSLSTLSGPPPLIQPAADAVKQWRYQPTLRNGEPVEVVTDIDVAFAL